MKRSEPDPPAPRPDSSAARGDQTREALVLAGLELFGERGYHAASSRALAEKAGVNQALIGYHFGGKRGLYLAVFEHILEGFTHGVGPRFTELEARLDAGAADPEALLDALLAIVDRFVDLFAAPESKAWAMLVVREQQDPSEAFDLVWKRMMGRSLELLTRLVATLRGRETDAVEVRMLVLAIVSQVLFFRVARTTAVRVLRWEAIGPDELAEIKRHLHRHVRLLLRPESRPENPPEISP